MAACLFAAALAVLFWWGARRPNVLLIVVDTLRADRLGSYGNGRGLTPFLDELAAKGTVFRNAYATSSWTCPSVASLLTSRFPSQHHVTTFESGLHEDEVTLGEILRAAWYAPGAYVANERLLSSLGYAQGFRRWWVKESDQKVRGGELRERSVSWLRLPWPQPRLLYLHYMEPHAPYDPPEPQRSRWRCPMLDRVDVAAAQQKMYASRWMEMSRVEVECLESLYDGEVASLDAELRLLFGDLDRQGFLDHAVVVFTADHGEEFGEHGQMQHGKTLYNEVVHVPLLISGPGFAPGGVVDQAVSLVDVAPTILDLVGLPPEPKFEGRSLVELMNRGAADALAPPSPKEERPVLLELEATGSPADMRTHVEGLVQDEMKLLVRRNGVRELYDLGADPEETHPTRLLVAPKELRVLATELAELTADLRRRTGVRVRGAVLDSATREKLRALGYQF